MLVALLGDSILDNAAYTEGGPDVVTHLNAVLPQGRSAVLHAEDGAVINDVSRQLAGIPRETTDLVISMGGNDALNALGLMGETAGSVAAALGKFEWVLDKFDEDYGRVSAEVARLGLSTTACTIYNGWFPAGLERTSTATAVKLFNDTISRWAGVRGWPVLELRSVCTEAEDYWNPIEPSEVGGRKIAAAIAEALAHE